MRSALEIHIREQIPRHHDLLIQQLLLLVRELLPTAQGELLPTAQRELLPTAQRELLPTAQATLLAAQGELLPIAQRKLLPATQRELLPGTQRELLPTAQRELLVPLPTTQRQRVDLQKPHPAVHNRAPNPAPRSGHLEEVRLAVWDVARFRDRDRPRPGCV
ncbi:hypothetical protein PLICRDRAFT_37162 [Plicaturopsis crispa FD-325 SS-3]|nr:hypothetical protein PLICRDRAFT_37162 [Plicaturopsis crispa FD-325 SS-3]